MRIRSRNVPVDIACFVLFLSMFFSALPSGLFVDLFREDWYWGCPASSYAIQHSTDGDWSGFLWNHLFFDLLFWMLYFSSLGLAFRVILRKVGLNLRLSFSLCVIGILTAILYVYLYRPFALINVVTGGYLSFLESRDEQIDMAMRFGDVETLQILFRDHPDLISRTNITGETPLDLAAYYGQSGIVKLLLADKADVQARDSLGETPLFGAALDGYTGTAELLLKNGAKANVRDNHGRTPLRQAAGCGNNRVVLLLLANKADVNVRDNEGLSPLHEAAMSGFESTVQLLIANNSEINVKDKRGHTPLYYAVQNSHINVADLLREHGGINN